LGVAALGALALAGALSGCVSTQQKATWAHVESARIIVSQGSTVVRHPGRELGVTSVTLLRTGDRVAVAVGLRNLTARALSDLPISVGVRPARGPLVYLNRAAGLDYFKTHVAEVPARAAITWVFTGRRPRRPDALHGRPFALAGVAIKPPTTVGRSLPRVRAVLAKLSPAGKLKVTVTNLSSVPQPELQLYAIAGGARGDAAAGSATVAELGTGRSITTSIGLIGRPAGAPVQLEALPTLFQ
jgi:hypothetical protein